MLNNKEELTQLIRDAVPAAAADLLKLLIAVTESVLFGHSVNTANRRLRDMVLGANGFQHSLWFSGVIDTMSVVRMDDAELMQAICAVKEKLPVAYLMENGFVFQYYPTYGEKGGTFEEALLDCEEYWKAERERVDRLHKVALSKPKTLYVRCSKHGVLVDMACTVYEDGDYVITNNNSNRKDSYFQRKLVSQYKHISIK